MNTTEMIMVRAYLTEGEHQLNTIVKHLTTTIKVRGISVFRAISGSGENGAHSALLLDLSLDLPLVIEFFDEKNKIDQALEYLNTVIKAEHVVFWTVSTNN